MFDITQHPLGQGAGQRAHAEVTSEAEPATAARPGVPLHVKALEGDGRVGLPAGSLAGWFDSAVKLGRTSLKKKILGVSIPLLPETARGGQPLVQPASFFAQTTRIQTKEMYDFTQKL